MINLLMKDLKVCFKADLKMVIKVLIGLFLFSSVLVTLAPVAIPVFISYIFIYRSFYMDERNKSDYFINSLPIEKEDVVYSKYIFALIIIIVSLIFTCLYYGLIKNIWFIDLLYFQTMMSNLNILLLLIAITFPIIFKYGYNKSYIAINLIMGIIIVSTMFLMAAPKSVGIITIADGSGPELLYSNFKLYVKTGLCILSYIISMYLSKKIYMKKEVAN